MNLKTGRTGVPLAILALGLLCDTTPAQASVQQTLEGSVVDASGAPADAANLLDTDYLLLYFSAHWCPPCRAFTPKLVDFYNTQGGGKRFDAVLISSDHSAEKMLTYMRETKMPWPAVQYGSTSLKTLQSTYSGAGIPRLVLIDMQGTVLADSYAGKKYIGPHQALKELSTLLAEPATK